MPDFSDFIDSLAALVENAVAFARQAEVWIAIGYDKAPALAIGIAVMLALLPLTILGRALNRTRFSDMTLAMRRGRQERTGTQAKTRDIAKWPADAWIEFAGGVERSSFWIGRRMVRIGRDDDNDIRLHVGTVHRHHAVIHHNDDAEFMIKDLSSADGNGVVVNGRRVGEARLRHGDTVVLGDAVLTFHLQLA